MQDIRRSEPLYEQVYEILWERIVRGEILPGDRLRDVEWAAHLGVSRTPVREAFRKLEHEGVLLPLMHGGYELRHVTVDDLMMVYKCRAALEGLAVRELQGRLTPKRLRQLEELMDAAESSTRPDGFDDALVHNTSFHDVIVEASGNPHLIRLVGSLKRLITFYRSSLMNFARMNAEAEEAYSLHLKKTHATHREIFQTLAAGDMETAEHMMIEHLFSTAADMDAVLKVIRQGKEATRKAE